MPTELVKGSGDLIGKKNFSTSLSSLNRTNKIQRQIDNDQSYKPKIRIWIEALQIGLEVSHLLHTGWMFADIIVQPAVLNCQMTENCQKIDWLMQDLAYCCCFQGTFPTEQHCYCQSLYFHYLHPV
mmetsp:Transcript_641/g.1097  ORF Transcript_641/g.1097 Transcript_641/m.1097 type:complete len:126 (+) Transcript_641:723-1100(+)